MWPVLRAVLDLPVDSPLHVTQAAVMSAGVAIWDVLANVHERGRRAAEPARPNDVPALLQAHPDIDTIAFIGGKARATFAHHQPTLMGAVAQGKLSLHVLPSSSRANTQLIAAKAAAWHRVLLQ